MIPALALASKIKLKFLRNSFGLRITVLEKVTALGLALYVTMKLAKLLTRPDYS